MDTPFKGLTIALSKGRILDETLPLFEKAGIRPTEDMNRSRQLIFPTANPNVRFLLLRASDVPTYVEHGAADIGVSGKDVLLEYNAHVYELIDLGIAKCRLMTAGVAGATLPNRRLRIATKYANVARRYFASRGQQVDIIKLYGSMELAPLVGLGDLIVDVVDTGNTLRANGLEPLEEICKVSSRLIANPVSYKRKLNQIQPILDILENAIKHPPIILQSAPEPVIATHNEHTIVQNITTYASPTVVQNVISQNTNHDTPTPSLESASLDDGIGIDIDLDDMMFDEASSDVETPDTTADSDVGTTSFDAKDDSESLAPPSDAIADDTASKAQTPSDTTLSNVETSSDTATAVSINTPTTHTNPSHVDFDDTPRITTYLKPLVDPKSIVMPNLTMLNSQDTDFQEQLASLLAFETVTDPELIKQVDDIIAQVRKNGDQAILSLTQQFDKHPAQSIEELFIRPKALQYAFDNLEDDVKQALERSAKRIFEFHEHQKENGFRFTDNFGNILGQKITPLDRVGIYVPGGLASYPSSVLMNAIPAKVAGVKHITMVVPAPNGELNPLVLAAAHLAGVDTVITIGGAQAVAGLAYGTQSIAKVDKITGPGNKYVACAKRAVFGQVGIDMIAGPSEVLVYAEGEANDNADWIAMDLLSQAEHDTVAQAIFVTTCPIQLKNVKEAIGRALAYLPKANIAHQALTNRGALILVQNREEAINVINQIAPEHLELSLDDPEYVEQHIRHAGAIFLGRHTPEAIGDYCAGSNHVLPTSGTARFSSPLGVYDFTKKTSLIYCTPDGGRPLARTADILAVQENLDAHALSARYRYGDVVLGDFEG